VAPSASGQRTAPTYVVVVVFIAAIAVAALVAAGVVLLIRSWL
jgi:hypothetical protein